MGREATAVGFCDRTAQESIRVGRADANRAAETAQGE
jgi:hypothetical protein